MQKTFKQFRRKRSNVHNIFQQIDRFRSWFGTVENHKNSTAIFTTISLHIRCFNFLSRVKEDNGPSNISLQNFLLLFSRRLYKDDFLAAEDQADDERKLLSVHFHFVNGRAVFFAITQARYCAKADNRLILDEYVAARSHRVRSSRSQLKLKLRNGEKTPDIRVWFSLGNLWASVWRVLLVTDNRLVY